MSIAPISTSAFVSKTVTNHNITFLDSTLSSDNPSDPWVFTCEGTTVISPSDHTYTVQRTDGRGDDAPVRSWEGYTADDLHKLIIDQSLNVRAGTTEGSIMIWNLVEYSWNADGGVWDFMRRYTTSELV